MRALLMSDWSQIWLTRWNWLSLIRSRVAIPLLKRLFSHVFQALSKPAKSRTHTRSCLKTVSTSFPCYLNRMRSNLNQGRRPDKENKNIKVIPQKLHLKFVIVHVWSIKLIKLFQRQFSSISSNRVILCQIRSYSWLSDYRLELYAWFQNQIRISADLEIYNNYQLSGDPSLLIKSNS